jgi:antitoxin (DNA-binding transcriptional repressor) of toxin-antitoxin stability system
MHKITTNIIGLRDLRENMDKYLTLVQKGRSFTVVRRSKPVFKIAPLSEDTEQWETIIDFTKIDKNGVDARKILKKLRELNAHA